MSFSSWVYIGTLIKINLKIKYSKLKASISTIPHYLQYSFFTGLYPSNKHLILKRIKLFQLDMTTVKKKTNYINVAKSVFTDTKPNTKVGRRIQVNPWFLK